jgi:hypothetical protein
VITVYRRNLQRAYIEKLVDLSIPSKSSREFRDVAPLVKNKLVEIHEKVKRATPKTKDAMTVYHLRFIQSRLEKVINAG